MLLPFTDRRVLLTGAGGSIGSALAREIARQRPQSLLLLDHSEANLHQLDLSLWSLAQPEFCSLVLGDITDEALLAEIFEDRQPEIVLHTAAFKHVPLMETHVLAAVRNNALGTNQLARMASAHGAESLVMVSTDKAVAPRSVMGASKRIAELAILRWRSAQTEMRAIRLGNVLGSQGSVVPTFAQQIAAGGPVTVTHPEANRFFFTMEESVELIVRVGATAGASGLYIPNPREPIRILNLAEQMIREQGNGREIPIRITGLRPGDKLSEEFFSGSDIVSDGPDPKLLHVVTPESSHSEFDSGISALRQSVGQRDTVRALEALCRLVPDYHPSETTLLLRSKEASSSR